MRLAEVNAVSLVSLGSLFVHLEKGLTVILLITAIVLNVKKFLDKDDR
ncbi:MAG: hypothetical protein NXH86_02750 [Flavobacteriaceae bacterium]|nr:hypothetical protein [Flavobacteriaceae bacterium]